MIFSLKIYIGVSQPELLYCAASLSLFHSHTYTHTLSPPLCPGIAAPSLFPSVSVAHISMLSPCLTSAARLIPLLCSPSFSWTVSSPSICQLLSGLFFSSPKCSSIQLSPIFFITLSHFVFPSPNVPPNSILSTVPTSLFQPLHQSNAVVL